MNLILKKFQEFTVEPNIYIGGEWNISIVHKNGMEEFPFGEHMKKNMIVNQGLDILASNMYHTSYNGLNWNTVPAFLLGDAVNGSSSIPVSATDTQLFNQLQATSTIDDFSCTIDDDYINGSRMFKKIYLFNEPITPIQVREIGIRTRFNQLNDENRMFSRFVLPYNINLMPGQYIKLFYNFKISCPALINSIPISLSSGTVNANGSLKLCGRYDDIFGTFDSNGNPFILYGDSPQSTFMPFCENFCVELNGCENECFGTGYLIANIFVNPTINAPIVSEWIGFRATKNSGNIVTPQYINGNFYRDITYKFGSGNPTQTKQIEGFLFTTTKFDRENTISGWLWRLNNKQTKLIEKEIVIQIRQSMSRSGTDIIEVV
jgi:hypothetical protein